eukprot:3080667-Prymnesium_polylepis.1
MGGTRRLPISPLIDTYLVPDGIAEPRSARHRPRAPPSAMCYHSCVTQFRSNSPLQHGAREPDADHTSDRP